MTLHEMAANKFSDGYSQQPFTIRCSFIKLKHLLARNFETKLYEKVNKH